MKLLKRIGGVETVIVSTKLHAPIYSDVLQEKSNCRRSRSRRAVKIHRKQLDHIAPSQRQDCYARQQQLYQQKFNNPLNKISYHLPYYFKSPLLLSYQNYKSKLNIINIDRNQNKFSVSTRSRQNHCLIYQKLLSQISLEFSPPICLQNFPLLQPLICLPSFHSKSLIILSQMNTIFEGIKIDELYLIHPDKNSTYKQSQIFMPGPLRLSLSPHKIRASRKFFYHGRHPSKKDIDNANAKQELEDLLRKQRALFITKKNKLNDLLLPLSNLQAKEVMPLSFPSIDIKRIGEGSTTSLAPKKESESPDKKIVLEQIKVDYHNNSLPLEMHKKNEYNSTIKYSQDTPERRTERELMTIPKINEKRAGSEALAEYLKDSPDAKSLVSASLSPAKSMARLLNHKQSNQKKFRKGYLSYQPGGTEFWSRLKNNQSALPLLKPEGSKFVTAKFYYVLDLDSLKPLMAVKQTEEIEIASLSKIMTCYLSILICKKYEVDMKTCHYRVTDKIVDTPGTSAELQAGDLLNVQDLMYGLMLPSGNDASICLAELMGKVLQKYRRKQSKKSYFQSFIMHMNLFSKQLDLEQEWSNSSGLPFNPNTSTAQAIVSLSALAMQNQLFRKIVNTKEIQIQIRNDRYGYNKKKGWKNTNRLLEKGWSGVKTGTTQTAGYCLMAANQNLLLGVFDCQTPSKRFADCVKLQSSIRSKMTKNQ